MSEKLYLWSLINMTWMMMTSIGMLTLKEKKLPGPQPEIKNDSIVWVKKIVFTKEKLPSPIEYSIPVVSPEITHIQVTLYGLSRLYFYTKGGIWSTLEATPSSCGGRTEKATVRKQRDQWCTLLAPSFCSFLCNLGFQYAGEYRAHSEWIFLLQLVLSSVKYLREWKHTHKYDQKCVVSWVTSNTVERTMKIDHPLCHVVFSFVCVLGHGQISTNTFMASNFTFYDT